MKIEYSFSITEPSITCKSFEHPEITIPTLMVPQLSTADVMRDLSYASHLRKLRNLSMHYAHNCVVLICDDKDTGYMAASYLAARHGGVYMDDTISVCDLGEDDRFQFFDGEFMQEGCLPIYLPTITMGEFIEGRPESGDSRVTIRQGRRRHVDNWQELYSKHPILITPLGCDRRFVDRIEAQYRMRSLVIVLLRRPKKRRSNTAGYDCYSLAEELRFSCAATVVELDRPAPDSDYNCAILRQQLAENGLALDDQADPQKILLQLEAFRVRHGGAGNRAIANFARMMGAQYRTVNLEPDLLSEAQALDFLKLEPNPAGHRKKKHSSDLCGCEEVKNQLRSVVDAMRVERSRREAGLPASEHGQVLLFAGAPGTGKTTAAKMLCDWLENEQLLENAFYDGLDSLEPCYQISGAQLKGKYVGQTAPLVHKLFEEHPFLFIDEAYALAEAGQDNDTFAQEAMAQLCIELENLPEDHVVVFAGYGGKHNRMRTFLDANPGLASRITATIQFDAYSPDRELPAILEELAASKQLILAAGWQKIAVPYFKRRASAADYGSGREARRLFESALAAQSHRLAGSDIVEREDLCTLTAADLQAAISALEQGFAALNSAKPIRCGIC